MAVTALLLGSLGFNGALLWWFQVLRPDQRSAHWARQMLAIYRPGPTVILGDSVIAALPQRTNRALNLAVAGASLQWIAEQQLSELRGLRPARVIIAAGINDLRAGVAPVEVAARMERIVDAIRRLPGPPEVTVLAVLPPAQGSRLAGGASAEHVDALNAMLMERCAPDGFGFVDHRGLMTESGYLRPALSSDGLHLNGRGLAVLDELLFAGLAGERP